MKTTRYAILFAMTAHMLPLQAGASSSAESDKLNLHIHAEPFLREAIIRCTSLDTNEGESVQIDMRAAVTASETRIQSIRATLQSNGETGVFTRSINVEKALEYAGAAEGKSMWISERNYGPRFRQVLVETPSHFFGEKSIKSKTTFIENRSVLVRDLELDCEVE